MQSSPHYKIILIGDCRVGKTSFLHYIINNRTTSTFHNVPPTIGVEYTPTKVRIRGQEIKVNLWDTSGAEKYRSITSSYYRKCQGAIIMFDLTDAQSFSHLNDWIKEIEKADPRLQKLLIANKMDLVESGEKYRQVSEKAILDFCMQHSLTFKYTSALTGFNIQESFVDFVQKVHEQWSSREDLSWQNQDTSLPMPDTSHQGTKINDYDGSSSSCPRCC